MVRRSVLRVLLALTLGVSFAATSTARTEPQYDYEYEENQTRRHLTEDNSVGRPAWQIIMRTAGTKPHIDGEDGSPGGLDFGSPGGPLFKSATANSTGANARTSFGDATGLYNAFFTQTDITKLALVSGDGSPTDPTSHTHYVVYDLVDNGTGSETLYEIIDRFDTFNKNTSSWHDNDTLFGSPSVTNFTAGTNGYSGKMTSSSNTMWTNSDDFKNPDNICIWGINRDYDNDAQVLCAYSGNLTLGKGDEWRMSNPSETFWSYWGNDWYRDTQQETISAGIQTYPGIATDASGYKGTVYLMGYGYTNRVSPPPCTCCQEKMLKMGFNVGGECTVQT